MEIANFQVNRKHMEQAISGICYIYQRNKRAVIPIAGKALSFLFGTLDEADLETIKTNIRRISVGQEHLKHVVRESITLVKDNQEKIKKNRQTINNIIDVLIKTITVQGGLERTVENIQRLDNIYIRFDRTISSLAEVISIARTHLQQIHLQLNMLSLGHLSPTVISPRDLRQLLTGISDNLSPEFKLPFDIYD